MSNSSYTNLKYDKSEMYARFDNMLKEVDEEYITTLKIALLCKMMYNNISNVVVAPLKR